MNLQLGTPAQTFQVIVDTGSDLVWIQCKPCTRCYSQQGPIFSPSSSSSSYAKLSCSSQPCQQLSTSSCSSSTCRYVYQYGDQSATKGDFSTETISLTTTKRSSQQIPNFAFGCGHTNGGSFGGAAGIVGLGQGPISLTSQLGSLIQNRFSYCLVSFDDAPSKTSPLLFGSAASLPESGVKSTPILKKGSTYYYVGLEGISVGGQKLSANMLSGTIFDSGTTLTLLEDSAYSAVLSAFQSAINLPTVDGSSIGLDLCFDVTGLRSFKVPVLSLHFMESDLNPPAANYFVLADSNTLCLAMGSSGGLSLSIIGNIMQQNHHILYDRASSTISFAPTQCDKL
ncbi:hypothetical protein O6H91_22G009200 [Diphasiastrum complanatum]|nr:hypothetical protein O6H91_22G009200 [Diphasiastrum complanatum]